MGGTVNTIDELKSKKDIPAVIANGRGLITYVNEPFESVFGWSSEESIGKSLSMIIPKNLHDAHNLGFSRFVEGGQPTILNQPLNLKAIKKDGTEFDAEHFIIAEKQQGQWIIGATIQPMAEN